jgi:hypothetical protein
MVTALALAGGVWGLAAGIARGELGDQDVEKITKAIPDQAPAKPAKPREVLLYSHCNGFHHGGAIDAAKVAFPAMGRKTGAFEAVVSDDPSNFEADKLREFDAVILSNTTGDLFKGRALAGLNLKDQKEADAVTERLRQNLLDFVIGGRGVMGIHAATDCSYGWHDYGRMIGGYFTGHPWHEKVGIKIDDPNCPLNAAFGGQNFTIHDEIYQFNRGVYARDRQRVILSLDMAKTRNRGQRKDQDYGISWIKPCGNGRVFYCALGHERNIFMEPNVLRHYLAGLQFILGDLDADMTPIPVAGKSLEEGWQVLFDGKGLDAWEQYNPEHWKVQDDGALYSTGKGGDIFTKGKFQDFILDLEFKVAPGTNSGVLLRTASRQDWLHTGMEIQVLDSYGSKQAGKYDCGALYDCEPPRFNAMRKAGEWNRFVIVCYKNRVIVDLNSVRVQDIDLNRWTEAHRNPDGSKNKFNRAYKTMTHPGYVFLQGHGRPVWFRNIKIKVLDPSQPMPS